MMKPRELGRQVLQDIRGFGFKQWFLVCLNVVLVLASLASWLGLRYVSGASGSISAAERFRGDSETRFAQLACYLPVGQGKTVEDIYNFRQSLETRFVEESLEAPEGGKLYLDAYSGQAEVTVSAENGSATVDDNGRGIPVGMHEKGVSAERLVFTTLHAGGKFDHSAYKTSGGLHGVGSSVVNALSARMTVRVRHGGKIYEDRYERGIPTVELVDGLLPVVGKARNTGTSINFLPDDEIFEKTRFKEDEIKSRLHETAYLNPALTIVFTDKRKEEPEVIEYHEPEGIVGFIRDLNKSREPVSDVVYFAGESEGISVEGAFQYVNEFHENVLGFCNNIYNAEGGTHLTGFKTMFTGIINTYARQLNILKEKDPNFTGADVRNGMTAVISIKHPDPRFEGQTKTKLDNQDAAKVVSKVTGEEVVRYFDRNLETLKNIIGCAEKAAKIRKSEERAKTNLLSKQKFSFDSNGKLANCESRDASKCEMCSLYGN